MPRLSPRIKVAIPVSIDKKPAASDLVITDLGMNGAFIKTKSAAHGNLELNKSILLNYRLRAQENMTHLVKVIREERGGYAIDFCIINQSSRNKLWDFISSRLSNRATCLFCGSVSNGPREICRKCGWKQDFDSQAYFNYYEHRHLMLRVNSIIPKLTCEQLCRTYEYLDQLTSDAPAAFSEDADGEFVGTCPSMLEVFSQIRKVATTDISVLLLGESGTGKELTAQAIHEKSARKNAPFVAINCGAIPENLLESELFGHEKGAFTGAHASTTGKLEYADGGTIFLDEIGEMPMALQVKLLRFLQDRKIEKVGSVTAKKVDVRLIAATNRDIVALIEEGKFRKDLYYRLNEFGINLPPLRERGDDKIVLARFFLNKFCREQCTTKTFTSEAVEAINAYDWPGNVREIINKIKRAMVIHNDSAITPAALDLEIPKTGKVAVAVRRSEALVQLEKDLIVATLDSCGQNVSAAAPLLGVTRQTLHRRLKQLGLRNMSG
ncbi:sigma-54 interaction domain-containing protein [Geomesophilobacter sediminis]|uniref:Sigma 54-interacting transcriptional regulator n=1 Tax=Geomesophilobacter sediminis TaxID=2798584 RepID=A0A8J7M4J1_9BACT|nr:sigma-54 dependent transcriptional regulator [Geomesophilobacter sediminis]MBJ6727966.1 sigma 54-interacting transcriptional regulator [Geomesophilobacter sediminis]